MGNNDFNRIMQLIGRADRLNREINSLKPNAVRELRKRGYSADKIASILNMGKLTVLEIIRGKKKKGGV